MNGSKITEKIDAEKVVRIAITMTLIPFLLGMLIGGLVLMCTGDHIPLIVCLICADLSIVCAMGYEATKGN